MTVDLVPFLTLVSGEETILDKLKSVGTQRSLFTRSKNLIKHQIAGQMSVRSGSSAGLKVPVLLFPNELVFVANNPASHKQVISIFNPYDFHLQYIVHCTAPNKYEMPDWKGSLAPSRRIDINIRMKVIKEEYIGSSENFRFQIFDLSSPSAALIGERIVKAKVIANATETPNETLPSTSEKIRQRKVVSSSTASANEKPLDRCDEGPSLIVVFIAIVCMIALCLPRTPENLADIAADPGYFTLTVNQQLCAAFILGLMTMVIVRR